MHKIKALMLSGLLLASYPLIAAEINADQWRLGKVFPLLMCPKAVSYLVNGGRTDVLVTGYFEDGTLLSFTVPAASSYALSFQIQSNNWVPSVHKTANLTAVNAINGEQVFSTSIQICENIIIAGPVRAKAFTLSLIK